MKRQFPGFEVGIAVLGLAGAVAAASCTPNNNVKPGAPVLTEMKIVEGGGATVTTIPSTVAECPDTAIGAAGPGPGGGMCDPSVSICHWSAGHNWCRCAANPAPSTPTPPPDCGVSATAGGAGGMSGGAASADASIADAGAAGAADGAADAASAGGADAAGGGSDATVVSLGGTWDCDPFSPNSVAVFTFDRLLDSTPLDPGDAATLTSAAMGTTTLTAVPISASYSSNGTPGEFVFPAFGDFLADGPSLLFSGVPELPGSATVSITLDPTKVLAKDGKTPFTGVLFDGAAGLVDGTLVYTTAAFSGSVSSQPTPPALPADAGACAAPNTTVAADGTPVVVTFNDTVDATAVQKHVTASATPLAGGAPVSVDVAATSADGLNVSIAPVIPGDGGTTTPGTWPANSTITVTLDATTPDLVSDTVGTVGVISTTFTTAAM